MIEEEENKDILVETDEGESDLALSTVSMDVEIVKVVSVASSDL